MSRMRGGTLYVCDASAEWFVDLYLGGAFTEKHDVDTEFPGGVLSGPGRLIQQLVHGRFARRLLASVRRRSAQLRPRRRLLTLRPEHRPAVKIERWPRTARLTW